MPMVAPQDTPEIVPAGTSPPAAEKGVFSAGDFLVALAAGHPCYMLTLGPTITGEDSGEFSVAARRASRTPRATRCIACSGICSA